jgi:Asp/Glu/hydantoin racemase
MSSPRIALVHATPIAMEPIKASFAASWPEAELINILEDGLSPDRAKVSELTDELRDRIMALASYGLQAKADAVLFTCSAFGEAIEMAAAQLPVPILKPNEAMFQSAIGEGGRVAMLYTFSPARAGMEDEFREEAARLNSAATLECFLVEGAIEAVRSGDVKTHNRLVAEKAASLKGFDAIMLAHFSTAPALASVKRVTSTPVFSSPDAAVSKLRAMLG